MTAIRIIAEIGTDMSVFETTKHLTSWAGLTPQNNESAGKKKTTRIAKSGVYIKPLPVQIALAASRSNKYPEIKAKHLSLKKRRGGKKAAIAFARRLLTAIFHMLRNGENYNPFLYVKEELPLYLAKLHRNKLLPWLPRWALSLLRLRLNLLNPLPTPLFGCLQRLVSHTVLGSL